jgi:hypothetical protein
MLRSRRIWLAVGAVVIAAGGAGGWYAWTEAQDRGGSVEEFCALVQDRSRFQRIVDDFDPSDVVRALDQLRTAHLELETLVGAAPSEVRSDLQLQADAVEAMIHALESVDPTDTVAAAEALNAALAEIDEVPAATMRLEAWTREHCGSGSSDAAMQPAASEGASPPVR